jgi:hypothetical protein
MIRGGKSANPVIFPPPKYALPSAQISMLNRSPGFLRHFLPAGPSDLDGTPSAIAAVL